MNENREELLKALSSGDPEKVAALIEAAYGQNNARLIEMLTLLINNGVSLTGMTSYGEAAIRVLSRVGRFDAVQLLLQAGANPEDIQMPELTQVVAFGTLAEVETWVRAGVDTKAVGLCGKPPLFYAIENGRLAMLQWLLEIGIDPSQTNEFEHTALALAAGYDSLEAVDLLLTAGADVNQKSRRETALSRAKTRTLALRLLDAGAAPQELSSEGRRAVLEYLADADAERLTVSAEQFQTFRSRRFGAQNPEVINNPFWEGMIHSGGDACEAEPCILGTCGCAARRAPIWCADRFGQSLTFLPDGRIVQIAGEHEDRYDPDFCIYNDVFVHSPGGGVTIYGYPETVFPPTDFHTATLLNGFIYLIGSLGYHGTQETRRFGETPVCRLNVNYVSNGAAGNNRRQAGLDLQAPGGPLPESTDCSQRWSCGSTGGRQRSSFGEHRNLHARSRYGDLDKTGIDGGNAPKIIRSIQRICRIIESRLRRRNDYAASTFCRLGFLRSFAGFYRPFCGLRTRGRLFVFQPFG